MPQAAGREPCSARGARAHDKRHLAARGQRRANRAEEEHGVEIDMRVEQREAGHSGERAAERQPRACCLGDEPRRPGGPVERREPVAGEKDGAAEREDAHEVRQAVQHHAEARDAGDDERKVGDSAEGDDRSDMLAAEALAQYEDVLGADGDDEPGRKGEAGQERGEVEHGDSMRRQRRVGQRKCLKRMKLG